MSIVITGGAGFLGSHVCERLLSEGFDVICVDNLLTGRKENIDRLLDHDSFKFIQKDVIEPLDIDGDVEYILHLASPASPKDYHKYPIQTLRSGAYGTESALNLALSKNAVFLLASTSEVYGDPEQHPQKENYWGNVNSIGPRSVYDEAKRYAEAITFAYYREYDVDIRIARIFNCYGPRMKLDDGRAVPNFVSQALSGKPITIYGNGSQTRSLCYVDDLVDGILRLMSRDYPGKNLTEHLRVVNLGNPEEITIVQLAEMICKLTNSNSQVVFKRLPIDDPQVRCPNIDRAKEILEWSPKIPLRDGLQRFIDWAKPLIIDKELC